MMEKVWLSWLDLKWEYLYRNISIGKAWKGRGDLADWNLKWSKTWVWECQYQGFIEGSGTRWAERWLSWLDPLLKQKVYVNMLVQRKHKREMLENGRVKRRQLSWLNPQARRNTYERMSVLGKSRKEGNDLADLILKWGNKCMSLELFELQHGRPGEAQLIPFSKVKLSLSHTAAIGKCHWSAAVPMLFEQANYLSKVQWKDVSPVLLLSSVCGKKERRLRCVRDMLI